VSYGETPGILSQDTARPWGERVREWRTERDISAAQLAALLKVSLGTLNGWESGSRKPKVETEYVTRFQALQVEAGEQPGFDDKPRVKYLWRTHLNNVRKGSRGSRRKAAA